jgi:pyruvate/2-oxoglutarate/acetoin dehydrogenase E1 component
MVFHNRPDFLFLTMDQLVNRASKWSYMFRGKRSLVVWACIGRMGFTAQHSRLCRAVHACSGAQTGHAQHLL